MTSRQYTIRRDHTTNRTRRIRAAAFEGLEKRRLCAAGDLDALFAGGGIASYESPTPGIPDYARDVVVQADGKVIVAGSAFANDASQSKFMLVRFTRDGYLDSSFGNGGVVIQDVVFSSTDDDAFEVGLQSDGKIVVAGTSVRGSDRRFTVARFTANGSFDTSFGFGGSNSDLDFNPSGANQDVLGSMLILPDNRILLGGSSLGSGALARFTADGQIDPTFDGDGKKIVGFGISDIKPWSGNRFITAGGGVTLAVFSRDGVLEASRTDSLGFWSTSLAVDSNWNVVVAGSVGATEDMAMSRYTGTLSLDTSFGNQGSLRFSASTSYEAIEDVVVQPDGKIVTIGWAHANPTAGGMLVARFGTNGTLDTTFGSGGLRAIPEFQRGFAGVVDDEGKIVAAGWRIATVGYNDFGVARLHGGQYNFRGTPFTVNQTIQAEDFDNGGQGVSYSDSNWILNTFGYYRATGVDIHGVTEPGGYAIVDFTPSEWVEYTINVPTTGYYDLTTRYACGASGGGGFTFSIDGGGPASKAFQPTGGWDTYQDHKITAWPLTAGQHVLRMGLTSGNANVNWLKLTPIPQAPYPGPNPWALPGRIEMENYDYGGEGVAYHDQDSPNYGGTYRNDGVDIYPSNGGPVIGFAMPGEWVEYTVNVQQSGLYDLRVMGGSWGNTARFHVEVDGANVTGPLTPHDILSNGSYGLTTRSGINLQAGPHVIRVAFDQYSTSWGIVGEFNWFEFTQSAPDWMSPGFGSQWSLTGNSLEIHSGAVTLIGDPATTHPDLNVTVNGGTLVMAATGTVQHLGSLTMNDWARAWAPIGAGMVVTKGLSLSPTARLDLSSMLLDYSGSSPFNTVRSLIHSGRDGGTWVGHGIVSEAARDNPLHNTTLGLMEASDFRSLYGTSATFYGEPIDNTAVLVRYTYYGDTDFNGTVDFDDYVRTDNGFNTAATKWLAGDFDCNGAVDFDDLVLIDLAFNTQTQVL